MQMLKIGIASYEQMKARTLSIARGELKPRPTEPKNLVPLDRKPGPSAVGEEPNSANDDPGYLTSVPVRSGGTHR